MRHFTRTSLGLIAFGLITPITVSAQNVDPSAPGGYRNPSAVQPATPPAGVSGQPAPSSAPATAPAVAHVHKGRKVCAACAAKMANAMPPGKIVGCAHSKNGVCGPCQAALNMPGTFVQAGGAPAPAEAPGRALASSGGSTATGGYDPSMAEPAPVGVVQAGFSQSSGAMPMAPAGMKASAPGRAVAQSAPSQSRDFYQTKSNGGFPHPHILGHLFGWSGIGSERRAEQAFKKQEAHAMMTYDPNAPTGVNELPASAVFGKQK